MGPHYSQQQKGALSCQTTHCCINSGKTTGGTALIHKHTHTVVPAHVFLLTVMHGYSVTLINNTGIADVLFWRDDCYPSVTNDTVVLYSPAVFEPRSDSY